ncbi:MAG: hypothetical protein ABIP97_00835 [Chthoniobacterales bacterium]
MQLEFLATDLAPGDKKCADRTCSDVQLRLITDIRDPFFEVAYQYLWEEFGAKGEMESREVIASRLARNPAEITNGYSLLYHLLLITSGDAVVAVHDHTAIITPARSEAIVHLSHVVVNPEWRRTGIGGWLRALPIQTARHAFLTCGMPQTSPITLVGEMEKLDTDDVASLIRLKAYEKGGYLKIDPQVIHYLQPDFRSSEVIDADGAKPIPMTLVVRKPGREVWNSISGSTVQNIVRALYHMYGMEFRPQEMQVVMDSLQTYPESSTPIALLPPTAQQY